MLQDEDYSGHWNAVPGLLNRSWFSRAWTAQEVAVAANALLICGDLIMDFDEVFRVCVFLSRYYRLLMADYGDIFKGSKIQQKASDRYHGLWDGVSNVALLATESAYQKLRKLLQSLPSKDHAGTVQRSRLA